LCQILAGHFVKSRFDPKKFANFTTFFTKLRISENSGNMPKNENLIFFWEIQKEKFPL